MISPFFILQITSMPVVGLAEYVAGISITNRMRHDMCCDPLGDTPWILGQDSPGQ